MPLESSDRVLRPGEEARILLAVLNESLRDPIAAGIFFPASLISVSRILFSWRIGCTDSVTVLNMCSLLRPRDAQIFRRAAPTLDDSRYTTSLTIKAVQRNSKEGLEPEKPASPSIRSSMMGMPTLTRSFTTHAMSKSSKGGIGTIDEEGRAGDKLGSIDSLKRHPRWGVPRLLKRSRELTVWGSMAAFHGMCTVIFKAVCLAAVYEDDHISDASTQNPRFHPPAAEHRHPEADGPGELRPRRREEPVPAHEHARHGALPELGLPVRATRATERERTCPVLQGETTSKTRFRLHKRVDLGILLIIELLRSTFKR